MQSALKLDPIQEMIDAMTKSVHESFKQILGTSPVISAPAIVESIQENDLSGVIPLVREQGNDYLVITFNNKSILTIAENIFGQKFETVDKTVESCVTELCNMTYGLFKTKLNQIGYGFKMSLPYRAQSLAAEFAGKKVKTYYSFKVEIKNVDFNFTLVLCQ
jgi:CheY-specific phosphatase CheX